MNNLLPATIILVLTLGFVSYQWVKAKLFWRKALQKHNENYKNLLRLTENYQATLIDFYQIIFFWDARSNHIVLKYTKIISKN